MGRRFAMHEALTVGGKGIIVAAAGGDANAARIGDVVAGKLKPEQ